MTGRRPRVAVSSSRGRTTTATRRTPSLSSAPSRRSSGTARSTSRPSTRSSSRGFSYGDYLRCGAIARFAPAMASVVDFARAGGLVLGICNGFPDPVRGGLASGCAAAERLARVRLSRRPLVVERTDTPFTSRCDPGQVLTIPVKHGDRCWHPGPDLRPANVVLRYAGGQNPNGSVDDVAGVVDERGKRDGSHAPSRARRRRPPRLDRWRAHPRLGARRGSRTHARRRLAEASAAASSGVSASAARSSRGRGPAASPARGVLSRPSRMRSRDRPLTAAVLEQLDDRGEALVAARC